MTVDPETLTDIRMPRYSWDYEDLTEAEHWFRMAHANLGASRHLLSEMIEERFEGKFHQAKVAVALFDHSVELFLKAAILQAAQTAGKTHGLQELYNRFRKLYPGKKFEFEGDINSAVRETPITPHNQYARYPTDVSGQPWLGHTHIDIVIWYREVCRFTADFRRLEPLLKTRYGQSAKGSG